MRLEPLRRKRGKPSTLVKYRDAKGDWTVQRKLVPELQKGVADQDIATKPDPLSARGRAEFTHTVSAQPLSCGVLTPDRG